MAQVTRARRVLGRGGGRRQVSTGTPPVNKGGGLTGVILLSLAVVFDVAKAFFASLFLTGSAIAGLVVAGALDSSSLTSWLPGFAKAGVGALAAVGTGVAAGPELEIFGIIAAMLIGFVGWVILIFTMFFSGITFFSGRPRSFLKLFVGFVASEVPLIDAIPTFTPTIWLLLRDERKEYRKELAAYKKTLADAEQAARVQQTEQLIALKQAQARAREAEQEAYADAA